MVQEFSFQKVWKILLLMTLVFINFTGFLASDPLCEERPAPEHKNECCVLVVCATAEEPEKSDERIRPDKSLSGIRPQTGSASQENTGTRNNPNIRFLQITPNSVQLQFPGITGGNLMYVEDRLFNLKEVPWENTIILEGNKIFTLRDLKSATKYRLLIFRRYTFIIVELKKSSQILPGSGSGVCPSPRLYGCQAV